MINKILKIILSFPVVIVFILVIGVNMRLYFSPEMKLIGGDTINYDLLKELHGLKEALSKNADRDMQQLYPEGYIFFNALYGLAWCNFLKKSNNNSEYFKEGREEIQKSLDKINSNIGRGPFTKELPLPFGAFYTGWSTFLLGKKLSIEPIPLRDEKEMLRFKDQCSNIASAVNDRFYPATYYGHSWPADVVLCIASLSLHDKLFAAQYTTIIHDWLKNVKKNLDPIGLIPHAVNPGNGIPVENARGSSQSLMLIFLKEIDSDFANQQFQIYRTNFLGTRFGLPGIREYRKGDYGIGDVDSGPVLLQMGSAATIVGMHTLQIYGEYDSSIGIRNAIEAMGFALENDNTKIYLMGILPLADAFIAWGHSAGSISRISKVNFTRFHFYSSVVAIILMLALWFLWRSALRSSERSLHIPQ